jgi:hypothetical protein
VRKILTRGLLRVQVMLTLTPPHGPVKPSSPYFVLSLVGVARPVTNTCSRSMATNDLPVLNHRDAQQVPAAA